MKGAGGYLFGHAVTVGSSVFALAFAFAAWGSQVSECFMGVEYGFRGDGDLISGFVVREHYLWGYFASSE